MPSHRNTAADAAGVDFTLTEEQAAELFDDESRVLLRLGGFGSGKSFSNVIIWIDRAGWDTGQRHGFFANTEQQALEGIFPELEPILDAAGVEWIFGTRPPERWRRWWDSWGIPYPHRGPRSHATLILENGLHVVFFGLANQKYKRAKGYQFGSIIAEEITELTSPWVIDHFLIPRNRCRFGPQCPALGHRHQTYLRGNPPPPDQPHWIREWVEGKLEQEAKRREAGLPPYFRYFRSSTRDNLANLPPDYLDTLQASMDPVSARALIDGDLTQALLSRTYHGITADRNRRPVGYDPNRPVLVSLDFNVEPAVATLWQVMEREQIAPEYRGKTTGEVLGIFGEFHWAGHGGMDAGQLAQSLIEGKLGTWPDTFRGLRVHNSHVIVYGDATGGMRRVESPDLRSAWTYVNDAMHANLGRRYLAAYPKANPSTWESAKVVNALANPAKGAPRLFIDPRCKYTWRDVNNVVPKRDGSEAIDKDLDDSLTHLSDTIRYLVMARLGKELRASALKAKAHVPDFDTLKPLSALDPWGNE